MKIAQKPYGEHTLPFYTATVRVRITDDVRVMSNNRPMKLTGAIIYLTRPSGHGSWTLKKIIAIGSLAKKRIIEHSEPSNYDEALKLMNSVDEWRLASYKEENITFIQQLEPIVAHVIDLVEQNCAESGNN